MESQVKELSTYISNLKFSDKKYENIITVEHRSNNPKRDFLFVNRIQAKHIPCSPNKMIDMCNDLANEVNKGLLGRYKNILVIGFAETATAIAHFTGLKVVGAQYIMCTTREVISSNVGNELITFEEEHSHATTQKLFTWKISQYDFKSVDYVLFVEDEISTGNTILNFIKAFKSQKVINQNTSFGVASICNWQDSENRKRFKTQNIDTFALITGELRDVHMKMDIDTVKDSVADYSILRPAKLKSPLFYKIRLGHTVDEHIHINEIDTSKLSKDIPVEVIGTEECMWASILIGKRLEDKGFEVYCHSTTRSSIDVISTNTNDIHSKYQLASIYEASRQTYIYNLLEDSQRIVITDIE